MNRAVKPVLFFRNTRWPFTKVLAEHQNKIQRHMLAQFFKLEKWPTEDLQMYYRRRMRAVSTFLRQHGTWGSQYAARLLDWAAHLERSRNKSSLAAQLYGWRNERRLQERRRDPDIGGASRPGTRSGSGPVHRRWDESVENASDFLASCLLSWFGYLL